MKKKSASRKEETVGDLTQVEIIDLSFLKKRRRIPSLTRRECIKKVWEVDPLECPKCHAEMKIISFINERRVIERILRHLDLWEEERAAAQAGRTSPRHFSRRFSLTTQYLPDIIMDLPE